MLLELRIGNLALAEDVCLRPGPGLTVLTGETGAGKSLVVGALALLDGGRADRQVIRRGEDEAWVEAVCDLSGREDLRRECRRLGVTVAADGLLVIRRELRREGRGRVLINGDLSSLGLLERLGGLMFAIQSQHQQRELSRPGYARDLLDAVLELHEPRQAVGAALHAYEAAVSRLDDRRRDLDLALQQLEMWRYQHEELTKAQLVEGEEEELAEAIAIKRHARALEEAAALARDRLDGGDAPARDGLGAAIAALTMHADKSPRLATALEHLEAAADLAADAAHELDRFLDSFEADPRGLDELEERKALYEELRRKYRRDVPGLVALVETLAESIGRHDRADAEMADLEADVARQRAALAAASTTLHEARETGAARVASRAEAAIRPLSLPDLDVMFQVAWRTAESGPVVLAGHACAVTADGADDVRLLVRTNPGEEPGEAAAIASGGEAARIHLGLSLLGRTGPEPLVRVFDEVDAGLGMDAATPVALLLRRLADRSQALCITHLPTVSVQGAEHWLVKKTVAGGRTSVDVVRLDGESRIREVARQLGGEGWRAHDGAAQMDYARRLLAAAGTVAAAGDGDPARGIARS
jgi:DNA repair protein RecN (Recombination protein N)